MPNGRLSLDRPTEPSLNISEFIEFVNEMEKMPTYLLWKKIKIKKKSFEKEFKKSKSITEFKRETGRHIEEKRKLRFIGTHTKRGYTSRPILKKVIVLIFI